MKHRSFVIRIFLLTVLSAKTFVADACRWDADTLRNEKKKKPEIAEIIFGTGEEKVDVPRLEKRISDLKANPHREDPDWWNNFAGAYIQLGEPQKAADLLEPVLEKFKDNYGVHANLGTAYHLLGRYKAAEREITRDLEINPDAHFGLEKYHLALLQYLSQDSEYQKQHVYVDEWTESFFKEHGNFSPYAMELKVNAVRENEKLGITNSFPAYFAKWSLATDVKLQEGVSYMATMNPREPACFTMLGIVCLIRNDQNLAAAAFEKAIALNSPQKKILQTKIAEIREFIRESQSRRNEFQAVLIFVLIVLILVMIGLARLLCRPVQN